jgi:hypothetical protein
VDDKIIATIQHLERRYETVYPYQVAQWLEGVVMSERMIRYRMVRLANNGTLTRVGERKGYMTQTRFEARFCLPLVGWQWG